MTAERKAKLIGAHVSVAGGLFNAPVNAADIGANAFALFTRNQRQWNVPPLSSQEVDDFRKACIEQGYDSDAILAHDSYLINLGHPGEDEIARSRSAFIAEMKRCQSLSISMVNFHPGSHLSSIDEDQCLRRIAQSIDMAVQETENVIAVIENTAGQGTNLGHSLEQLAVILDNVKNPARVGICIDTCHAFAAGYDISSLQGYNDFMERFDQLLGMESLRGMHLNDSKNPSGKRVDRHAPLGKGFIGMDLFKWIIHDSRTDNIPLILETPEKENWPKEIEMLRSFMVNSGGISGITVKTVDTEA
ncbi:MAG: deoxyribonuclease IV [Candidatus Wallbacteria bacterium HGW-Wallbacteria-1]|jgi:deoxyribonuclease-4|uniref:Probable endonuclease 4 n=1 Tax=Candidatus Wallbacteria bacterium HGW-Wallbacteria-1 TaxID=2013854 RepID=A0A2N1PNH2_9BACT|nr:MAG: deoxyribonuclease IV [Candidatus Wallbacteria bacterium HGW-Wallbacteria-1]